MSKGAGNSWLCGTSRRGPYRGSQTVYGKYLNDCDDNVKKNLAHWLNKGTIVLNLKPVKIPLLRIVYLDYTKKKSWKEDSIDEEIQELGFQRLLVLIYEGSEPKRRNVGENVIQLMSEKKAIPETIHNKKEIERMIGFIKEKAIMLAFSHDQNKTDYVLQEAVKFIEKECSISLVDVKDPPEDVKNFKGIKESPLVIFCKNDSQLQEDINHAKQNARDGPDVMLLVLTNRNDMHLVDTKATEGFGMKSQLIFSSMHNKFRKKQNRACILWLYKFIELNGYNVSRRLSRSESLQLSFRQIGKRKEEGFYQKLHNVPEEMEKSAVLYFQEKQNLSLHRMGDDCQESRPFILFCRDCESADDDINQFIEKRQAKCDLRMTVVVLLRCERQKPVEIPNVPNIQRLSIRSSQEPIILPTPANGRIANKVREFLLAKSFDNQKKNYEVTYNAQMSPEEETNMSEATNSMKQQPKTTNKYDTTGFYEKLHNVSEEMEKRAVLYFQEKQNLSLQRMGDDCQESRPFILFCRDCESAEDDINQFKEKRQTKCDLHMIVVLLSCEGQKSVEMPHVRKIQRLLMCSSQEPTILHTLANVRVSEKVKEFLLGKRSDEESIQLKKEGEVTHKAKRSTEEEKNMSGATNSVKRQPETSSKHLTQCDTREFYEKLHNVSEEMEKSAVLYFQEKQNLSLQRMGDDCQESRPFILFCRDCESAEDDINQFKEKRQTKFDGDLHMIVLLLSCEGQKSVEIPSLPNIQRLFIRSSQEPKILHKSANVGVSDKVKEFLLAKRSDKESIEFMKEEEVTCKSKRSTEEENKKNSATNSRKQPETSSKHLPQPDTRDMESKLSKLAVSAGRQSVQGLTISIEETV